MTHFLEHGTGRDSPGVQTRETWADRSSVLIVPGLRNSGPTHWQSWFETQLPDTRRVEQADWELTCLSEWAARVAAAIDAASQPVWIVAHSFGCLASVTAAFTRPQKIRGALLVAPADPDRFGEPPVLLEERLAFPSLVVASRNDPWVNQSTARYWARIWGSGFVDVGAAGHINCDSGHGPWPEGLRLFEKLKRIAAGEEAAPIA